jgi:hypothetical protein
VNSAISAFSGGALCNRCVNEAAICFAALDIDQDPGTLILHPSLKPEPVSGSVNKGSKTDTPAQFRLM